MKQKCRFIYINIYISIFHSVAILGYTLTDVQTMTYADLKSKLNLSEASVAPYKSSGSNVAPEFFNINVGNSGFAFIKNPWPKGSSVATIPSDAKIDWNKGVLCVVLAFDSNKQYISDLGTTSPQDFMGLFFDASSKLPIQLQGKALILPLSATSLGSGGYSNSLVVSVSGASSLPTANYPASFTIQSWTGVIANQIPSSKKYITITFNSQNNPYQTGILSRALPNDYADNNYNGTAQQIVLSELKPDMQIDYLNGEFNSPVQH